MQLWYGPPSPFSRKVRVAIIECGLEVRVTTVPVVTMNDNPDLAAINPLMKVPTLVTDENCALYDSRVICEYLDALDGRHQLIPARFDARLRTLCRQALGDGLMEALIFIKVPLRRPLGDETSAIIIERQKARIERSLDVLEAEAAEMQSEGANVGCIAVACALGWQDFNFPAWGWRATRPRLAAWFETFSKRASMRDTVPVRPGPGSEKVRGRTDI